MNLQVMKWCVDVALGIVFLISGVTGLLKFAVLVRLPFFSGPVLPMAMMSEIHDRAGVFLFILVALHLFLNRQWILLMTRRIVAGTADSP